MLASASTVAEFYAKYKNTVQISRQLMKWLSRECISEVPGPSNIVYTTRTHA